MRGDGGLSAYLTATSFEFYKTKDVALESSYVFPLELIPVAALAGFCNCKAPSQACRTSGL